MKARFITFEGIDGAGKSTHVGACADWLRAHGRRVVQTREPGGSPLAEALRACFLAHPTDARTEALLAFAARSDHLARLIRPGLAAGDWVVCDRFTDSTVAYQGAGRGLGVAAVEQLEAWLHPDLRPDRTYLFDLAPEEAARRRASARAADRFEAEDVAFFARVRDGYRARAAGDPQRFLVLDAAGDVETIAAAIRADLAECLRRWSAAS